VRLADEDTDEKMKYQIVGRMRRSRQGPNLGDLAIGKGR